MTLRVRQAIGILSTLFAFLCFSLMDWVEDYSPAQDILQFAGYALVAAAIVLLVPILGQRA